MGNQTRRIIEHARANGGVITTGEAQALGMDRATLARRVSAGVLTRVKRGVFALPALEIEHEVDLEAACRRLNAIISHQSAARLHGYDGIPWSVPSVTVPHRLTHSFPGVVVHQSTDISDQDVVSIRGLPVTSAERTIVDLAAVMSDARLDWILDRALSSGTVDLSDLADLFATVARRGKPGTARMRRLLAMRDGSYVPPDTALEQNLLRIIKDEGLPLPALQFRPAWLVPTDGRVDFAYPQHRLIIEADSRKWHLLMESFNTDRQRDNQALLAGWRVLRFTWQDIAAEPEVVGSSIRSALGL